MAESPAPGVPRTPLTRASRIREGSAGGLRFGVYANLGQPIPASAFARSDASTPRAFAEHARAWRDAGARIVGGCCSATPEPIRTIADRAPPKEYKLCRPKHKTRHFRPEDCPWAARAVPGCREAQQEAS